MSELPDWYFEKKEKLIARIKDGVEAKAELDQLEHQFPMKFSLENAAEVG